MKTRLVPLAVAYLLGAGLVAPAALLAADDAAQQTTTTETNTTTTTAPAPQPKPSAPSPQPSQKAKPAAPPAPPSGPTAQDAPASDPPAPDPPVARASGPGSVTIKDFAYSPASITVNVGDTVTWTNQDTAPHSATGNGGSFDTGVFGKGKSGSHTFDKAGTFAYICSVHPNMHGTVVVQAASSGGGGNSGSGGAGGSTGSSTGGQASTSGSTGSSSKTGPGLPATGLDVALLAFLGFGLFGLGRLVHRQAAREL